MNTMRHAPALMTVLALSLCTFSFAAQPTQPATDDANQPGGSYRQTPPPGMGGPGMGGPGMGSGMADPYRGYVTDFPSQEVDVVPVARAQSARFRAEHDLAMRQLHRWIDTQWDDFTHSREYLDTVNAERKAQDDYARERDRVVKRLQGDSNYKTLLDLINDLNGQIENERPHGTNQSVEQLDGVVAVATVKMGYASTLSAMEAAALAADNAVQDARNRLVDASNRARDMRGRFSRSVRHDPDFVAGRSRIDGLMVERIVADNFLEGAVNARNIALRYSYYLHRWDQYRNSVYGLYGYGSYGYGNGYGYGGGYGGGMYQPVGYGAPPPPGVNTGGAYMRRY